MSDERQSQQDSMDEVVDDSAPTERDPSVRTVAAAPASSPPSRGVALSVLWWREDAEEEAER